MIVVDSNILAYLYLPGDFTEQAERLLGENPDWVAPSLWRSVAGEQAGQSILV